MTGAGCPTEDQLLQHLALPADAPERAALVEHLDGCPDCRAFAAELVKLGIGPVGSTLPTEPAGPDRRPPRSEARTPPLVAGLRAGQRLGRFVLEAPLGRGAAGVVWAAWDPELDRQVALKLLRGAAGAESAGAHERLLAEARALARLSHPNVVAVHDAGTHEGAVFIAMERLSGGTLRQWLHVPRRPREVVSMFTALARGLAAAHEAGIVHGDFKPENVLLDARGQPRLADFGLARDAAVPGTRGRPVGTPAYMAPELLRGEPPDARSDQYAFGVALYEALGGQRPEPDQPLREIGPGWLQPIVSYALAPEPDQRFPNMDALAEALERDPTGRRNAWIAAAAAAVAVVVAAGVAVSRGPEREQCAPRPQAWAGVWDEARRGELRASFERSGRPFAAAVAGTVARALDRYREEWLAADRGACLDTLGSGQPQELLDLRTRCLQGRLAEAKALVDLLARGDPEAVRNGATAVSELQPLSDCADAPRLRAGAGWPLDPSRREEVKAAWERLAAARAQYAIGDTERSLQVAQEVAGTARATGYKPLEAEAELLVAQICQLRVDSGPLVEAAHRAAAAAESTGQFDLVVRAWTQLARLGGAGTGAREGTWAAYAEAVLGRITGDTRVLRGGLRRAQASAEERARRYDRALGLANEALALLEPALGPDHALVSDALAAVASANWYLGRLDEALAAYRRGAEISLRTQGPHHPSYGSRMANLASVLTERGDYGEALAALDAAGRVFSQPDSPIRWNLQVRRAVALAHLEAERGGAPGAEALGLAAMAELEKRVGRDSVWALDAASGLSEVHAALGQWARALPLAERVTRALEPTAKDAQELWGLATARSALGECLLQSGQAARAAALLEQAARFFEENGTRNYERGESLFRLARAQWALGRRDEALATARGAAELLDTVSPRGRARAADARRWLDERSGARPESAGEPPR